MRRRQRETPDRALAQMIRKAKLYDLAAVTPVAIWYGFGIVGSWWQINPQLSKGPVSLRLILAVGPQFVNILFLGLLIVLFAIRRAPVAKAKGWLPRTAALVGYNIPLAILALPRAQIAPVLTILSSFLVISATVGSICIACWLGRAFSIFPQARAVVTDGPYRFVRHPLYLSELIGTFGMMCQFQQPWSFLIAVATVAAQFPRMHFEEQILTEAFPYYRNYADRTARLIPGLY